MDRRVLILDGAIDRDFYRPVEHWARHFDDVEYDAVHLPSGEAVPPLDGYTHVIVTGSEASIVERSPWFDVMAQAVRDAAARDLSILGSCFGHQMLVTALSGPEYVRRATVPEVGWIRIEMISEDPLFADAPKAWHALGLHFDEAVDPPPPWRVLATSEACVVEVIRYGDRPIWRIQPHPEIEPQEAKSLLRGAASGMPDQAEVLLAALRQPIRDDETTPEIVKRFLESEPS
ncbi:MAG: type 1 glutamine amidotransferase [Candidatus Bipolaricaulia bacterium]